MTGFQINPGTEGALQTPSYRRVDPAALVASLGVDSLDIIDPFRQEEATAILAGALGARGVRVVISRRECALPAARRGIRSAPLRIDPELCRFCKACLRESGCPALIIDSRAGGEVMAISAEECTGCGLCQTVCRRGAVVSTQEGGPSGG
jgi:indolepyruvate ferredoxin oxidoreductase alpha subunit